MKRNIKRKSSVVRIVVTTLFVGMFGTTVYSVGELQKTKYQQPSEPQVVEIEKECPVLDVDKLDYESVRFLTEVNTLLKNSSKITGGIGEVFNSLSADYLAQKDFVKAQHLANAATQSVKLAHKQFDHHTALSLYILTLQ